jgi:hypothetical protein
MRYFSDALEDRRVSIRDSGINPYAGSYTTPSTELRKSLTTVGKTLTEATVSNITNTNPADSFTKVGSSNSYELLSRVNGGNNDAIISDWTSAGAFKPSGSIALTEFKARFGEVPVDANGNFNKEAMIAKASAGFNTEYGGNRDGASNFPVSNLMGLDNDGRRAMLGNMKAEYEAQKAAKFEEDLRLAKERDAAKEAKNNPAASGNNGWGKVIATIGTLIQAFGSSG